MWPENVRFVVIPQVRVEQNPDRQWQVVSLIDGDLALRDGLAHGLVRQRLAERRDVDYRYVRAWEADPDDSELGAKVDFLLIGRPRLFSSPRFALLASKLEGKAYGEFHDPGPGRKGLSIHYGKARLTRHELEEPFGEYRRYDQDYGLLLCRREFVGGEERSLVAIAGLGVLGTLGLTVMLTDEARRKQLVRQVEALAPLTANHMPEKHIEIGIRFEVEGHKGLVSLLNNISKGEAAFTFQVEVVAIQQRDDTPDLRLFDQSGIAIDLQKMKEDLPSKRFTLLRHIVEGSEKATPENLCRTLGFVSRRSKALLGDQERVRLAKLVHDLNTDLRKKGFARNQHTRLIRFDRKRSVTSLKASI